MATWDRVVGSQQAVDRGLALAIATNELGAQRVELVVPIAAVVGHPTLERRQLVLEGGELVAAQLLEPAEAVLGADAVELVGEGVVGDVVDGPRWPRATAGEVGRQHHAELAREVVGALATVAAMLLGANEVDPRLGDAAHVRHLVVLALQPVAERPQVVERERPRVEQLLCVHHLPPTGTHPRRVGAPPTHRSYRSRPVDRPAHH
jgi:hypothetical protein